MLKRILSASLFVLGICSAQTPMTRELGCTPASASGTAYTCSISPAPAALVTGATYYFVADVANTAAASINFNSLGAKTVVKMPGGVTTDLVANDIRANQVVVMRYDGSNMQMISQVGNAASGGGSGITTQDEGAQQGTSQTTVNCVGSGIACSVSGSTTTVTVSASGTVTDNIWLKAAGQYHGSGGGTVALWEVPSSGGPTVDLDGALVSTNYSFQALNYQDTSVEQAAYVHYPLHDSWTGSVSVTLDTFGGSATGNALWKIYTACASTGSMNPLTFNAANTTTATYGGAYQRVAVTLTSITMTGCSAGNLLTMKVARDSTSGSDTLTGSAYAIGLKLKTQHN
jgi:hypothetical protein